MAPRQMKLRSMALLFISLMGLAVVFQNCSSYQPDFNPQTSSTDAASNCTGSDCNYDDQALSVQIANPEIHVSKPGASGQSATCDGNANRCFEVSGYCRTGGFPSTVFFVRMEGTTGFSDTQNLQASCDETGRFNVLVTLPSNYDYSAHTVVVTMKGVNAEGNLVDNPTADNSKGVAVLAF